MYRPITIIEDYPPARPDVVTSSPQLLGARALSGILAELIEADLTHKLDNPEALTYDKIFLDARQAHENEFTVILAGPLAPGHRTGVIKNSFGFKLEHADPSKLLDKVAVDAYGEHHDLTPAEALMLVGLGFRALMARKSHPRPCK